MLLTKLVLIKSYFYSYLSITDCTGICFQRPSRILIDHRSFSVFRISSRNAEMLHGDRTQVMSITPVISVVNKVGRFNNLVRT